MDIVEQLRKHQCPENKGCNPVVEYCQCALMDSGADEIERLREALRTIAMSHLEKDDRNSGWGYCISIARSNLQQKDSE